MIITPYPMGDTFPSNIDEFKYASSADEALPFWGHRTAFSTGSSLRYFLFQPNCNRLLPLGLALGLYNLVMIAVAAPEIQGLTPFK